MRILIGAALLVVASTAAAQMYRWTDHTGKTHFTDTPPPASARNVQRRSGGGGAAEDSDNQAEPYSLQMARKKHPVKLYSAPGCGAACDEARKLLNSRGVPFAEVSVASESGIAELKNVVGSASVPALVVGGRVQKGFEEGAYHSALDSAGYPKAGILPPRRQAEPQPPEGQPEPADKEADNQGEETSGVRGPYAPDPAR
jgi:glutaredoxin